MKIFKILIVFTFSFLATVLQAEEIKSTSYTINEIIRLDWSGPITPATVKHIQNGLAKVPKDQGALLITLNTPGGLVSATKDILTLFGDSNAPIIVWVKPEGASATSAGALIAAGAHVLVMSEGTNIGAATPVTISGDIDNKNTDPKQTDSKQKDSDSKQKAVNDLVALVKSLSEVRGRNSEKFAEMVTKASSFETQEALRLKLIDGVANTQADVEKILNGRTIHIKGQAQRLEVQSPEWVNFKIDFGIEWLNVLSHPSLAYILFLIGAALIYFELQAPGGYIAGGIGLIALVLSGIGFQVLPVNYGAFGLIILAFILFILEIFITSYGLLSIAGLASLLTGSLFLFRNNDAYIEFSSSVIYAAVLSVAAYLALVVYIFFKNKPQEQSEFNDQTGKVATIHVFLEKIDQTWWYQVKVGGEVWRAKSHQEHQIGEHVKIKSKNNKELYLTIQGHHSKGDIS